MEFGALISAFVTLFVVVDPVGLAAIFLGLTSDEDKGGRRRIAFEACAIAMGVLAGSALFGGWLLRSLGIGFAAFRIAGGLLLFAIAFEMVFERRQRRKEDGAANVSQRTDTGVAAFPLAIPLMAGPGAITATILLAGRTGEGSLALFSLLVIIALVILVCLGLFILATELERLLGRTALAVFGRLLGVLLAALAVQYVIDGILAVR
jgi:multiple antibiotic resistance protein